VFNDSDGHSNDRCAGDDGQYGAEAALATLTDRPQEHGLTATDMRRIIDSSIAAYLVSDPEASHLDHMHYSEEQEKLLTHACELISEGTWAEQSITLAHIVSHICQLREMVRLGIIDDQEIPVQIVCAVMHDICKNPQAVKRLAAKLARGVSVEINFVQPRNTFADLRDDIRSLLEQIFPEEERRLRIAHFSIDRIQSILNMFEVLGGCILVGGQHNGFEALQLHELAGALVIALCVTFDHQIPENMRSYVHMAACHRGMVSFLYQNMAARILGHSYNDRYPVLLEQTAIPYEGVYELAWLSEAEISEKERDQLHVVRAVGAETCIIGEALASIAPYPVDDVERRFNAMDLATYVDARGIIKIVMETFVRELGNHQTIQEALERSLQNFQFPIGDIDTREVPGDQRTTVRIRTRAQRGRRDIRYRQQKVLKDEGTTARIRTRAQQRDRDDMTGDSGSRLPNRESIMILNRALMEPRAPSGIIQTGYEGAMPPCMVAAENFAEAIRRVARVDAQAGSGLGMSKDERTKLYEFFALQLDQIISFRDFYLEYVKTSAYQTAIAEIQQVTDEQAAINSLKLLLDNMLLAYENGNPRTNGDRRYHNGS